MAGLDSSPRPDRMPAALLAYAVAVAVFLLVPPYLKASIGPPVAFTLQELADLLTPVFVLPLAWRVFEAGAGLRGRAMVAFLVIGAVWIEGQGIHLAANAIGDAFSHDGAEAFYGTVPGDLDHWLDETLGHWLWHAAWVALTVLMLAATAGTAAATRGSAVTAGRPIAGASVAAQRPMAIAAGAIHGVTFFLVTVEGVTTALGIPASLLFLAWSAVRVRREPGRDPVATFVLVSSIVTLIGYLGWSALHGWTLPEFSKVGLFG